MMLRMRRFLLLACTLLGLICLPSRECIAHEIVFCGEVIPVNKDFVANKLMNVIRNQIPNVNLPSLRQRALTYFPYVSSMLKKAGIPEDFKYLPIVESGFMVLTSRVGARGFWQIMPGTAKEYGLVMNASVDERDDIIKSTAAATRLLVNYYNYIQKQQKIASWVLTAAAYNFGIGNIIKAIKTKGTDYFSMNLNAETALYVYKIIAVKELFEYPELYMKNFGYNVFTAVASSRKASGGVGDKDEAFSSVSVNVSTKKNASLEKPHKSAFVAAHIKGKYKDFADGDLVALELDENLTVQGGYTKKGSGIKGEGWIIDGRVFVDLGYGHDLLLYDTDGKKGLALESLKKGVPVLLKNDIYDDGGQWK